MQIYADNAATSFPKPAAVSREVYNYIKNCGGSPGRGSYAAAVTAGELLLNTRVLLAQFFNATQPKNIVFTSGATMSLNILISGLACNGAHFVTTAMEHNSVLRPLENAKNNGGAYTVVPCEKDGSICTDKLSSAIQKNTVAIITTHASNVCGTVLPIEDIGRICKQNNVFYIIDAAQTAGLLPVSLDIADAVAFAGHKALYGIAGIGGFAVSDALVQRLSPLVFGGTGSFSHSLEMPALLPDRFEAGTINMAGVCSLYHGVSHVIKKGQSNLLKKELSLAKIILQGFLKHDCIEILGKKDLTMRTGVVSANFKGFDNGEIAFALSENYGIATRCGLHCAPLAHKALGSFKSGCVRFSLSSFNTAAQAECIVNTVDELIREQRP